MTLIPHREIQELRGQLEHWSVCNDALATEMRYTDKLLVARSGVISPQGTLGELNHPYIDFCDSLSTIRMRLLTDGPMGRSYTSSYSRVLSVDELLSIHGIQTSVIWLGSDDAPAQCGDVDLANRLVAVFPYSFFVAFMSLVSDLPPDDFFINRTGSIPVNFTLPPGRI